MAKEIGIIISNTEFDVACEALARRLGEQSGFHSQTAEILTKGLTISAKNFFQNFAVLNTDPRPMTELQQGFLTSLDRSSALLCKEKLFDAERLNIRHQGEITPHFKEGYLVGLVYIDAYALISAKTFHNGEEGIPRDEFVVLIASLKNAALGS